MAYLCLGNQMKVARKSALKSIRLTLRHPVTPQWFQNTLRVTLPPIHTASLRQARHPLELEPPGNKTASSMSPPRAASFIRSATWRAPGLTLPGLGRQMTLHELAQILDRPGRREPSARHSLRCQRPKIQITISNISIRARKSSSAVIVPALTCYSPHLSLWSCSRKWYAAPCARMAAPDIQCLQSV
jgi:hypothetical protein